MASKADSCSVTPVASKVSQVKYKCGEGLLPHLTGGKLQYFGQVRLRFWEGEVTAVL